MFDRIRKRVRMLSWGWWIFPRTPGLEACDILRDGRRIDLAAVFVFTAFGFGVCVYDRQDNRGRYLMRDDGPARGWAVGRFEVKGFRRYDQTKAA